MYIGPGAGFAFLGSFLTLIAALFLAALSFLTWPFRMLWITARGRRGYRNARVKKLIFLGLDGFDPRIAESLMAEQKLPNLSRLASEGSYRRLRTTFPALSPVAWSTFATGVNPAKHNIFDFLNRDLKFAGIPKTDERGRTLDVHALRTTFGTLLSKGGVAPRTAQAAMRHSDIRLTMQTYTDPKSDRRRMLEVQQTQQPGGVLTLMAKLPRAAPPGTRFNYSTGETQVAGALLRAAVRMPLA